MAREAWRSMKNGTIALSFGYLVTADRKRDDGVRELLGSDLFEVTLTPSPANPETRVTSMKSAGPSETGFGFDKIFASSAYTGKSNAAHEKARKDRELLAIAAKAEAAEAKAARKSRPIKIARFEV